MSRKAAFVFAALASLALGGCATVPRLEAPEVRAVSVEIVQVALPDIRLAVALSVWNPNPDPVRLAMLDATLEVEGRALGRSQVSAPVTLAPSAVTLVRLDTRIDAGEALSVLGRAAGSGASTLAWRLSGSATLDDGRRYPFSRSGITTFPH